VKAVAGRPASGKLAINRLRDRRPLLPVTIDRFLARHEIPIVEGSRCTFLYRGEADAVFIVHRTLGLPDHLPLRRLRGTDLWAAVLELPDRSRIEYQLEVVRGGHRGGSTTRSTRGSRTARWAARHVCYARGTRSRTGPGPTRTHGGSLASSGASRALRRTPG
jgi:enterochelin esterase family protein